MEEKETETQGAIWDEFRFSQPWDWDPKSYYSAISYSEASVECHAGRPHIPQVLSEPAFCIYLVFHVPAIVIFL